MRFCIKEIMVFNSEGLRSKIVLNDGVNIITGDSKTGKSALLEIIDFCLCSKKCTVPKGVITNYAALYALVVEMENETFVIGRTAPINGGTHMYIRNIERQTEYDIQLGFFNEFCKLGVSDARETLERKMGLFVSNMSIETEEKSIGKASVRNMMSYLFQHQNLIANKFALFYRLDDYNKRLQVINQFPVFAGWVDQEYYTAKLRLDTLEKQKRIIIKSIERQKDKNEGDRRALLELIKLYYNFTGNSLGEGDFSLSSLIEVSKTLPEYDILKGKQVTIYGDDYKKLLQELEQLEGERIKLERRISELEGHVKTGDDYSTELLKIAAKSSASENQLERYICPLCETYCETITQEIQEIHDAVQWLDTEIQLVKPYKKAFGDQWNKARDQLKRLNKEISQKRKIIVDIENIEKGLTGKRSYYEQVLLVKARIETTVNTIRERGIEDNSELESIENEIEKCKLKLGLYRYSELRNLAADKINAQMNWIASKLDLEREYLPPNLVFDLERFELLHRTKSGDNIYLNEMGSGANWLSCHLALFLSLLAYFAIEKNSIMPSFLFLDQPSQVYFPDRVYAYDAKTKDRKVGDLDAVQRIFSTIIRTIDEIEKKAGYKPQVIITDHVDNLDLGKYEFSNYLRERYRDGKKFIVY